MSTDSVHEFVASYESRDPDYTPTDAERALIEDAINAYLSASPIEAPGHLQAAASVPPDSEPVAVTEAQAAYALLWRTRTTDPAIHAARRALLATIGKEGQRDALQWALDTFGPMPEPSMEDFP